MLNPTLDPQALVTGQRVRLRESGATGATGATGPGHELAGRHRVTVPQRPLRARIACTATAVAFFALAACGSRPAAAEGPTANRRGDGDDRRCPRRPRAVSPGCVRAARDRLGHEADDGAGRDRGAPAGTAGARRGIRRRVGRVAYRPATGERMSVADLLRALLLESANDAANTLAVRASGSVDAFVARMNREATRDGPHPHALRQPDRTRRARATTRPRSTSRASRAGSCKRLPGGDGRHGRARA